MNLEKIKEIALANGFSLKEQASGKLDLHSYVYEFANAIEQAAKAKVPEWISVDDQMPEKGSVVLGRYLGGFMDGQVETVKITGEENPDSIFFGHWIYLPKLEQSNEL